MIYSQNLEGDNYKFLIVPYETKEDFLAAQDLDLISSSNIYSLNFNATCECSINFVKKTICSRYENIAEQDDFKTIQKRLAKSKFNEAVELIVGIKNRSSSLVARNFYNHLQILVETIGFFNNVILHNSPLKSDENWLQSEIAARVILEENFKFGAYSNSSVKKLAVTKFEKLKSVFEDYVCAKPSKKLEILTSHYLFHSQYSYSQEDRAYCLLLIHRAVECYIMSILVEEREININSDGTVVGEKYKYMSDYYQILKSIRAYDDEDDQFIREINNYRNNSKLAHGYSVISEYKLSELLKYATDLILEDHQIKRYFSLFKTALSIQSSIGQLAYDFVLDENFVSTI
ncbi:hypothetical protein A6F57_10445 [Alteromonas stellipolaris]|uniref:hypothetical protein n=1 Tax=Alteromonas stellipolaris TaxID=233316 RepID=UPI0007B44A54|nr:hypothetical protein [Alteromonas stellipolaris]ANB25581.1 hypothetical protein A6F57_10445 [Alteromonas stellipolaris]